MSSSLLARGLLAGVALSFLAVPAAFAEDPSATATTTETTTGTTTETTTSATTIETTTGSTSLPTTEPTTETPTEPPPTPDPWAETAETLRLRVLATRDKAKARRWRALMGHPRPYLARRGTPFASLLAKRQWQARKWHRKAYRARQAGHHPPHLFAWRCIHSYEGSWRDPNAPYFGGLQMDLRFQGQYGRALLRRKGTADHWTPLEQMWVAERAYRSGRGFYPWPVTARRCGLI